jgi:Stigma-specific protein, Stig1
LRIAAHEAMPTTRHTEWGRVARLTAAACWLAVVGGIVAACSLVGKSVDGFAGGQPVVETPDGQASCPPTSTVCDGVCVDTTSNVQHCGTCQGACKAGEACNAGTCEIACPGGQVACGGLCYQLSNDLQHCGSCTVACKPGEVCGNGLCTSNCPTGQDNCGGSCADLQTDPKHCGACATACGPNDECVTGKCVIACKTQLNQAITDPWGWGWDGLERAATSWDKASATCQAFRGRLPTASELYRVSATQSATVGQTSNTNPLWSLVPYGDAAFIQVRLSDAIAAQSPTATSLNYRCVCPPPMPAVYSGQSCNGAPSTPCYPMDGENKRYNLDTQDRVALHKGGAIWECSFYRGRLATPRLLAEAILQGVGTGSGAWLHTADEATYQWDSLVHWTTGTGFVYEYTSGGPNSLAWADTASFYPFRCVGESYAPGPHPAPVPNEWIGPLGQKSETNDLAAATFIDANDQCWALGGHVPSSTELGELVAQGLPNGSGANLWSSDETGYDTVNFTVASVSWKGSEPSHLYAHGTDLTWVYKHTGTLPFRCIFYPVDTAYAGPVAASCAGGCTAFALPGASGAKIWLDSFDRAPPATTTAALDTCRKAGGHLASQRDLMEAVRHSLPNGSTANLATSDLQLGASTALLVGVGNWKDVDTKYDDLYPTYTTWSGPATAIPFRCSFTNELR